jgi:DNA-binding transcriptional MerR regulator
MEKPHFFTSEEVLAEARTLGLDIAERKLKYYVTVGILPRPQRRPSGAEGDIDGRMAYFPPETIERLVEIKKLQDSGFTLPQIKNYFNKAIDPVLKNFLEAEDGSSGGSFPLESLAKVVVGDAVRDGVKKFQQKVARDKSEQAFREAAQDYYLEVLAPLLGQEKAARYVRELLVDADGRQREKMLAPFRKWKEQAESAAPGAQSPISSYLDELCHELRRGSYKEGEIREKLQDLAEKVQGMQLKYQEKARIFNEAFEIAKFMRQVFWIYLKALLEIENFLVDRNEEHLMRAGRLYSRADDMLRALEELIGMVKKLVALGKGIESL